MCWRIMTIYLLHRIETEPVAGMRYETEIRQTVLWLMKEYGSEAEAKKLEFTKAMCSAAVTVSGSRLLSQRLAVQMDMAFRVDSQSQSLLNNSFHCALTAIAYLGDVSRLKTLINAGVDVNGGSQMGGKPLQAAAARGHMEISLMLLNHGADANSGASEYDNTPLQLACFAGHEGIVRILLNPKYSIQRSGPCYERAILSAVRGDHVDLMQLLMKLSEAKFFGKDRMLQKAAAHGAVNVIRTLLDENVNVNSQDDRWRTPLQRAASRGHEETVRLLIARGADYSLGYPCPIHQAAKRGYERVVQILLDAGDDIDREGEGGPLTAAVKNEKVPMIQYLLNQGINLRSKSIQTALNFAAGHGYEKIVRMLAAHGADVNHDDHRPMLSALMFGQYDVVQTLLEFGAQTINVSECKYAAEFASGEYPIRRQFRY